MHEVSKAINILDTTGETDKGICKGKWKASQTSEEADKCWSGKNASGTSSYTKLSDMFKDDSTNNSYPGDATSHMGTETSKTISTTMSALNKDQHRVVSSAFAKAATSSNTQTPQDIHH